MSSMTKLFAFACSISLALAQMSTSGSAPAGTPSGGASSGGSAHGGSSTGASGPNAADSNNLLYSYYILVSLASLVIALWIYRLALTVNRYIRAISCLDNEKQAYWKRPTDWYALIKEHIVYAPLFRTRHHRELLLVKGWSVGVLPTRFQSLFLTTVIAMNVTFCVYGLEWEQGASLTMLNHLRNRTGTLAVANMLPLVLMAGRNNPLIGMLNMSYDSFNMMHRWFGRIIVAEAVTHMVAFFTKDVVVQGGWGALAAALRSTGGAPQTGLIVS
jgi:hypothetical protein